MLHLPFLPHQNPSDLVLGCLWRFPISPLFRVTASARAAHLYVIGMSGKGKSKLLQWCLYQDIAAGRGCGLIAPHSLLVDDLLRLLITRGVLADPDIHQRLIYVDPARTDYVVPFNVLATQAEHPYDIAAAVLEAFRRTWPECLKEAPHFSNVVTTTLIVLYELHEVRIVQPDGDPIDDVGGLKAIPLSPDDTPTGLLVAQRCMQHPEGDDEQGMLSGVKLELNCNQVVTHTRREIFKLIMKGGLSCVRKPC
jgi:hypothetical protein